MEDIIRSIIQIQEEIREIRLQIEMLKKRPDVLFKEDWMDGQDVQLALNISPGTLRSMRRSGKLPFSRINMKIYYKVSDVKALMLENYGREGMKE
jgi:hypothetical protein